MMRTFSESVTMASCRALIDFQSMVHKIRSANFRYRRRTSRTTEEFHTYCHHAALNPPSLVQYILATFLLQLIFATHIASGQLIGNSLQCEGEGTVVKPSFLIGNPCINCLCRSQEVVCRREVCEDLVDCALVITTLGVDCCEKCKGCRYNGDVYRSGDVWTAHDDVCQTFQCREGVITASVKQCEPIDCPNVTQVLPGECCPSCAGCFVDGEHWNEGETFARKFDPCTECVCENGRVTCSKQTCPVLSCPEYQAKTPEGECCPKCVAQRKVFDLGDRCLFQNQVFDDGETVYKDKCTKCVCLESTVMCHRETCPSMLNCPSGNIVVQEGDCCPHCEPLVCDVNGTKYQDGDTWHQSVCEACSCQDGVVRCRVEECRGNLKCSQDYELKTPAGECCPRCVEKNGVCTVFGDPHYRSFDGRLFNFQGRCKYLLAEDCTNNDFRVRVRNDGRHTKSFSWTKTVFVTVGKHSVTLMQDYVVRVNKEPVSVPHVVESAFKIFRDSYNVILETNLGVSISWDGDSFVELSVPPSYKNKMCGLCGNYNGDRHDDLRTQKGEFTNDVATFGESWRVGGSKLCDTSGSKTLKYPCWDDAGARRRALQACRVLRTRPFQACHDVVDVWVYYRSCVTDMCECPERKLCSCEAVSAYVRECKRQGVEVKHDQNKCLAQTCPEGANFVECGPACPRTCATLNLVDADCPSQHCVSGCRCPNGQVLHDDKCIAPSECP